MRFPKSFTSGTIKFLAGIILAAQFGFSSACAQQIESTVKVLLERLPLEKQRKLKNFSDEIENYLNDYDWTENSDDHFTITTQIFLQDVSVNYEDRYSGTFVISNNSDIQFYDKYWIFPYQAGEPIFHDETQYNPFTGFIDFYVYLVLGSEYDKFGKFLGTPFFEKAKHIANQSSYNVQFNKGWKERTRLIDYILSDDNKPFREVKDAYFLGRSYIGEEDSTAKKYCRKALFMLEDVIAKNKLKDIVKHFIEAHHLEFIDMFKDDQEVMDLLIRIDPDRAKVYRKYAE